MRRFPRTLALALGFALLLFALSAVVFRQSRSLEALRRADVVRDEAALLEARRAQLTHRIQELEARGRVVAVASARLGMRVPSSDEIVLLPASRSGDDASSSPGLRGGAR